MSDTDPHAIANEEELRELVGNPPPGLDIKVTDHLDHFAMAFLERCPFLVLATSDPDGQLECVTQGRRAGVCLRPGRPHSGDPGSTWQQTRLRPSEHLAKPTCRECSS